MSRDRDPDWALTPLDFEEELGVSKNEVTGKEEVTIRIPGACEPVKIELWLISDRRGNRIFIPFWLFRKIRSEHTERGNIPKL